MTTLAELAGREVTEVLRGARGQGVRAGLEAMGIATLADLLTFYPRLYIDRTNQLALDELSVGETATVMADVRSVTSRRSRNGRAMVEVELFDSSGHLRLTFFNQSWRAKQLKEGTRDVVVWGKVEDYRGRKQMTNPLVDLVGTRTGRIVAIYPQSEKGLSTSAFSDLVEEALDRFGDALSDPLSAELVERLKLPDRASAMRQTHRPESMGAKDWGRKRLGFDELLRLQTILVLRKRSFERDAKGLRHEVQGRLLGRFIEGLPFPLTGSQQRAIEEIRADLARPIPMHRLLQGDVGSGKTVVALAAMLVAVEAGHQGALMVPTEVLAEQHFAALRAMVGSLMVPGEAGQLFAERPLSVELLTSGVGEKERRRVLDDLQEGRTNIVVGTHALLTEDVKLASLGLVVIDEQHRFGVEQRAALREKGAGDVVPDVLVMTATPIPRTAAMTVFGDLDTTVLAEMPPGRTPVATVWAREPLEEELAWTRVREEVAAGHQAYVVCPLVEGSERVQARSATEERDRLADGPLAGLSVGLIHGQLPAGEKDAVMGRFRQGEVQVLVATTVIEVGVDVPNATVMVISDADRFGMAQLHQLRGRVGRGTAPSWCFLLGTSNTPEGQGRLEAMEKSTDGFELAEIDLDLRGEGTILGARQKGATDLKLASLRRHRSWVERAREVAFEIVDADPGLAHHLELAEELKLLVDEDDKEFLFKS